MNGFKSQPQKKNYNKEVSESFISSFTNDTRIGYPIGDQDDIAKLHTDLNSIFKWAIQNMKCNTENFECVKYGQNEDLLHLSQYTCQDNNLINEKDKVKNLGVLMRSDESFSNYIDKIL